MRHHSRAGVAGVFMAGMLVIAGCSDSSSGVELQDDDQTEQPAEEGEDTGSDAGEGAGDDAGSDADEGAGDGSITDSDGDDADQGSDDGDSGTGGVDSGDEGSLDDDVVDIPGNTPDEGSVENDDLSPPSAGGNDASGGQDDSPTAVESASLAGPFIKDTSRAAGPPSAPSDLTLLLAAEKWLEFSWAPSTDDQSVEAYEIYRDNELIATVRGDTDYEHDYRSWLSTSYIDCNFTRYTDCAPPREPVPGASYSYSVAAVDNEGMRSPRSESVVFTFEELQGSTPDLGDYVQVFDEEFEGNQLDITRWKTALPWGPDTTINGESQYFVNIFASDPIDYSPFEFTGTTLKITGKPTPDELLSSVNNQPYLSGVITTADYFRMTYGYVEMNARVAGGQGLLSTFYLFNQDYYKNKPEIDIVEYIGSRPDKSYQTYHYYDSNRARYASGEKHSSPTMETVVGTDLSAEFHKYSVLWEPGLVIWYIDGQEVRRMTGPRVSDEPMNIIAHLVVGSSWIGEPAADVLPAEFEIDYIKAWQKQ